MSTDAGGVSSLSDWQPILKELDSVPCEDPRWETASVFAQEVTALAVRKLQERELVSELATRLDLLRNHFWCPQDLLIPELETIPSARWSELNRLTRTLSTRISEVDVLDSQQPLALDLKSAWSKSLSAASDACAETWQQLTGFVASLPTVPSGPTTAVEPHTIVEQALEDDHPPVPVDTPPQENAPVEPTEAPPAAPAEARTTQPAEHTEDPQPPPASPEPGATKQSTDDTPQEEPSEEPGRKAVQSAEAGPQDGPRKDPADVSPKEQEDDSPEDPEDEPPEDPAGDPLKDPEHDSPKKPEDQPAEDPTAPCEHMNTVHALVGRGRWTEAYWLAYSIAGDKSLRHQDRKQGERMESLLELLLATISFFASPDEAQSILLSRPPGLEPKAANERLLAGMLAIAGYSTSASGTLMNWLSYVPERLNQLSVLAGKLQKLSAPLVLSTEELAACADFDARHARLQELESELRGFEKDPGMHPDWGIWSKLVSKESRPLWTMVHETVEAKGQPSKDLVRTIEDMQSVPGANVLIDKLDNGGHGEMHPSMRRNIVEEIRKRANQCDEYNRLLAEVRRIARENPYLEKASEARRFIKDHHAAILEELDRERQQSLTASMQSAGETCKRMWIWLLGALRIHGPEPSPNTLYVNRYAALSLYPLERDENHNIAGYLLQDSRQLAAALASGLESDPTPEAIALRVSAFGDFRFIEDVRSYYPAAAASLTADLDRWRDELKGRRMEAETAVSRAWALGFIGEDEKTRLETVLSEIQLQVDNATRLIGPGLRAAEDVLKSLEAKENEWIASLRGEIHSAVANLRKRGIDPSRIKAVEAALVQIDSRQEEPAVHSAALTHLLECLRVALAEDDSDEAAKRLININVSTRPPQYLQAFLATQPRDSAGPWGDSWSNLPKAIKNPGPEFLKRVIDVLNRLQVKEADASKPERVSNYGRGTQGVCGVVDVRASGQSPIPQFGSKLTRVKLAIHEDRDGDLSSAIDALAKLGEPTLPSIVLYTGSLSPEQRLVRGPAIAAQDEETHRPTILVIDLTLWNYLEAFDLQQRWNVLLHCALPFTYANPYKAFGHVPKELFFGRDREIAAIAGDPGRSRLLYGGRQLGKTAILEAVQRGLDNPAGGDRGQRCLLLDLRNKFRTQQPEAIWFEVRRLFAAKVRAKVGEVKNPEATINYIQNWIGENSTNSMFILVDEADSFLHADARQGHLESSRIAALMRATDDRFRMVFAGNLEVARHALSGNHPLNEFGDAVVVHPAAPRDARRLLEQPLQALGILLSEADIYRILARTNYYPGLIQYIGERIVAMNAINPVMPPVRIDSGRITKLFGLDSVMKNMTSRFELTVALSPDYRCIVSCLVQKQLEAGFGAASVDEHLIYEAAGKAWPRRFQNMPPAEFEVILKELIPLGVVVNADGGYRLRSANLLPLFGSAAALKADLKTLERQALELPDDFHPLYDKEKALFSPLSQTQATLITGESRRINLVFSPCPEQWDAIVESLRSSRNDFDFSIQVPKERLSAYSDWYAATSLATLTEAKRITIFADLSGLPQNQIPDVLQLMVPEPHLARSRTITFVLGFTGQACLRYLAFPAEKRAHWEKDRDVVTVRRWSIDQIRLALNDRDIPSTWEVGSKVEQATGGWHLLLAALFKNWRESEVPDDNLRRFSAIRASGLDQQLLESLGLAAEPWKQLVRLLDVETYAARDPDVSKLNQDAVDLFGSWTPPAEVPVCLEYLQCIDVVRIAGGNLEVDKFILRICEAER